MYCFLRKFTRAVNTKAMKIQETFGSHANDGFTLEIYDILVIIRGLLNLEISLSQLQLIVQLN